MNNERNKLQVAALDNTTKVADKIQAEIDKTAAKINRLMRSGNWQESYTDCAAAHAVGQEIHNITDNITNTAARIRDGLELMRAFETKLRNEYGQ